MKTMKHERFMSRNLQHGSVSIFSVIFAMLLITIVTVGFVQLMVRDQQQASAADLSQSAYDSALAGVEDAKRFLVYCQGVADPTTGPCAGLATKTCAQSLDAVRGTGAGSAAENLVQGGAASAGMNQAYTCLKMNPNPIDYKGKLDRDESRVIALTAMPGQKPPAEMTLEWMTREDIGNEELKVPAEITYRSWADSAGGLVGVGDWAEQKWPAAMLVQRIANTAADPLAGTTDHNASWDGELKLAPDNSGLLLLPAALAGGSGVVAEKAFPADRVRPYNTNSTDYALNMNIYGFANCQPSTATPAPKYYCSMKLRFSTPAAATLFKITSTYRGATYRITMKDADGADLNFSGVQASIDSTGRSADVFRRVEARVDLSSAAPYPDAAVESRQGLCKNAFVSTEEGKYRPGACSE